MLPPRDTRLARGHLTPVLCSKHQNTPMSSRSFSSPQGREQCTKQENNLRERLFCLPVRRFAVQQLLRVSFRSLSPTNPAAAVTAGKGSPISFLPCRSLCAPRDHPFLIPATSSGMYGRVIFFAHNRICCIIWVGHPRLLHTPRPMSLLWPHKLSLIFFYPSRVGARGPLQPHLQAQAPTRCCPQRARGRCSLRDVRSKESTPRCRTKTSKKGDRRAGEQRAARLYCTTRGQTGT